jgi:membrane-associated phospholipid phosphatase
MDYSIYEAVNDVVAAHAWIGNGFGAVEAASIPFFLCMTLGLWLLARPGGPRTWKLASASALTASALALLGNRIIASFWMRPRPYAAHPGTRVFAARSHDASFPSDHASASFAIAFAVLAFDPIAGAIFLVAAVVVAGGRVAVGLHYPADVAAGLLMGLAAALVVVRFLQGPLRVAVGLVERVTDPLLAPVWRVLESRRGATG